MADESPSTTGEAKYVTGTATIGATLPSSAPPIEEATRVAKDASIYYGLAKPRRIIIRAKITHGKS
jgi:hypothetical protein